MGDQTTPIQEEKPKGGLNPTIVIIALLLIIFAGFYFLTKSKNTISTTTIPPDTTVSQTPEPEMIPPEVEGENVISDDANMAGLEITGVKTIEVEAGSFYFKPATITVNEGDRVKIVLKSVDMMHNFELDEFNVDGEITKAASSSTVEFIASKAGIFEYYCGVGSHRAQGQVGKLIVK